VPSAFSSFKDFVTESPHLRCACSRVRIWTLWLEWKWVGCGEATLPNWRPTCVVE
jgi:hypothetical protein